MTKKRYYISVQDGTVMYNQGDAAYELEINADEEDLAKLNMLFEMRDNADDHSFFRGHLPGIPYHFDEENDMHDDYLKNIYAAIYRLGTHETKQHIDNSGLREYIDDPAEE